MSEPISKRVGRIISGSVNALVSSVEDSAPEMILEEAVREVDSAIEDVRLELGKTVAGKHLATKRLNEKNTGHEQMAEKIAVALQESRDDLAEVAISQQLDIEAQIPVLEHTIAECGDREKELEGFISALQAKKREMQDELKAFRAARARAGVAGTGTEAGESAGYGSGGAIRKAEQATSTFDRVLEKHAGLAGVGSVNTADSAKLAELETLSRQNRIKERLAALKNAGVGKKD